MTFFNTLLPFSKNDKNLSELLNNTIIKLGSSALDDKLKNEENNVWNEPIPLVFLNITTPGPNTVYIRIVKSIVEANKGKKTMVFDSHESEIIESLNIKDDFIYIVRVKNNDYDSYEKITEFAKKMRTISKIARTTTIIVNIGNQVNNLIVKLIKEQSDATLFISDLSVFGEPENDPFVAKIVKHRQNHNVSKEPFFMKFGE